MNNFNLLNYKGFEITLIKKEQTISGFNIDGDFVMCGKEVAAALGYKNPSDAVLRKVMPEDKVLIRNKDLKALSSQHIRVLNNAGEKFINESGLYALIFGSELPSAIEFKRWVTKEVLPQIRKTGSYNASPMSIDEEKIKLIVEKIALEHMVELKTDKAKQNIEYLRTFGISKAKACELTRKAMKYNIKIEKVLDDHLNEVKKIKEQGYDGKIKSCVTALSKVGYGDKGAWLKFAEVAQKTTGKDLTKLKEQSLKQGCKITYLQLVKNLGMHKEVAAAMSRFTTNELKKIRKQKIQKAV